MKNVVVVGSQWGDEGKGKIVDWLSSEADVVVRFQGGHNAGHTLVIDKKVFKLRPRTWLSIFRTNTPYSKENLRGDLESLESFYKNRGYLNFSVNNSIITISENKKELFITVDIFEGEIYKINEVSIAGDIPIDEQVLETLIFLENNSVFSQELIP